jgi:DNA methylase
MTRRKARSLPSFPLTPLERLENSTMERLDDWITAETGTDFRKPVTLPVTGSSGKECWLIAAPLWPSHQGTVLDPFAGSVSEGCAAAVEGFNYLGIEKEAEYVTIAEARIKYWDSVPVSVAPGNVLTKRAPSVTLKAWE